MNDLKMLMIYNSSLNLENGSNTHIFELTRNLSNFLNLTLFAPKSVICNKIDFVHYIYVFNNTKVDSFVYQITYQAGLLIKLFNQCITNKPDIIYERQCGWSFLPALIAKIFNIPYIVEINGLMIDELKLGNSPNIYIKISAFNERTNYNISNKIIAVTQGIKNEIIKLYNISNEKIVVINNGANTDLFYPLNQKEAQTRLNLEHSNNYICFVGNLAPWQGVEYLIRASPIILEKYPNTYFLIVGDGVMKKELIQLTNELGISDKFIFTGGVSYEMVPIYINAADICVAPFIQERNSKIGLSALKTYEYLACGKPTVASDIPGVKELLDYSGGGISVASEGSEDFANAILKLISNESLRNSMGKNGREYIVANHSWDSVARKVINICNDVLGSD